MFYLSFLLNKESFGLRGKYSIYMRQRGVDKGMLILLG